MRAWQLYGFGDMRLEELEDPRPGPGEALVRTRVVQPSVTEAMLAFGTETFGYETVRSALADGPARLFGHEYCAEIVALGEGVEGLAAGDRVADVAALPCMECALCLEGRSEDCRRGPHVGFEMPGCLSDVAVVPALGLVPVPDGVSDAQAACLQPACDCVAGVDAARLEGGETVAVIGQGPMGGYTLQLARAAGAGRVIAIDVRAESLATARELGADDCVDASDGDPVAAVLELTGGRGVDVAFESAGGAPSSGLGGHTTLDQAREMTRDTGRVVVLALLPGTPPFDMLAWRGRSIELLFPPLGSRSHLARAAALAADGALALDRYTSHSVDGLERVAEAFEITANKGRYGALGPCQVVVAGD